MHAADRKVCLAHLLRQPLSFLALVAEDDGLRDSQRVVQVAQRLKLELLSFHGYEELLDALECQLVALHKNLDRIVHEFIGHLQDFLGKRRGNDHAL